MKIKILYFSGTGNTAYTAARIREKLVSKGEDVDVIPLEKTDAHLQSEADELYFGFPIYACEMPPLVKQFLTRLPEGEQTVVHLFCTKAYFSGKAMLKAASLFEEKGYHVASLYERKMPGSDGLAFLKKDSSAAKKLINNFNDDFSDLDTWLNTSDDIPVPGRISDPGGTLFGWLLEVMAGGMKKKFYADDRCISCGRCTGICPVGNISLKEGSVTFSDKCALCMRCIHQCPAEAIQIGKMTSGKFRYKGPDGTFKP